MQITPIRPLRVAATARRVAGRITSTTGTSYRSRASRSIAALAELQAITSALTPSLDEVVEALEGVLADLADRLAGRRAAGRCRRGSTIDSCGSWSITDRATVSPPNPESKMPIGASDVGGLGTRRTG